MERTKALGAYLRKTRENHQLKAKDVSRKVRISCSFLHRIERDAQPTVRAYSAIYRLCLLYGLDYRRLFIDFGIDGEKVENVILNVIGEENKRKRLEEKEKVKAEIRARKNASNDSFVLVRKTDKVRYLTHSYDEAIENTIQTHRLYRFEPYIDKAIRFKDLAKAFGVASRLKGVEVIKL